MSKSIKEFMNEVRTVDRWFVLKVALGGAFCGVLLATAIALVGLAV